MSTIVRYRANQNTFYGLLEEGKVHELVGGLFYGNYPGGTGLMAGAVFGRIAGAEAVTYGA